MIRLLLCSVPLFASLVVLLVIGLTAIARRLRYAVTYRRELAALERILDELTSG